MKSQERKPRAAAHRRRERPNLEANYHKLGIPAVVAAVIPGRRVEEPDMPRKPLKDFHRD